MTERREDDDVVFEELLDKSPVLKAYIGPANGPAHWYTRLAQALRDPQSALSRLERPGDVQSTLDYQVKYITSFGFSLKQLNSEHAWRVYTHVKAIICIGYEIGAGYCNFPPLLNAIIQRMDAEDIFHKDAHQTAPDIGLSGFSTDPQSTARMAVISARSRKTAFIDYFLLSNGARMRYQIEELQPPLEEI